MDPETPLSESHLFQLVQQQSPDSWSDRDVAVAVRGMLVQAVCHGRPFCSDWAAFWPVDDDQWEAVRNYALYHFEREPQTAGELDGTAHLAELSAAQAAVLGNAVPVPPNLYMVGPRGPRLHIGRIAGGIVSKAEAINLAAWLVAFADPKAETTLALADAINRK